MTDKITLANVATFKNDTSAVAQINSNNALITTAFDNTLSLDGTAPNQMNATLDMNSNPIINLPFPSALQDPVRLVDLNTLTGGGTLNISGIPNGGVTNAILAKNSPTNQDTGFQTLNNLITNNGPFTFSSNITVNAFNTVSIGGPNQTGHWFEVNATLGNQPWIQSLSWNNDNINIPAFLGRKSRGGSLGIQSPSISGDTLCLFGGYGSVNGNFFQTGNFTVLADTTVTSTYIPGRLSFNCVTTTNEFVPPGNMQEVMRIDSNGRWTNGGQSITGKALEFNGFSSESCWITLNNWASGNTNQGTLTFRRSASGAVGTNTAVPQNFFCMDLVPMANDGAQFGEMAAFRAYVDGANCTLGSTPGRLTWWTTASGSRAAVERMKLDSSGNLVYYPAGFSTTNTTPSVFGHGLEIHYFGTQAALNMAEWNNDNTNIIAYRGRKSRGGTLNTHAASISGDTIMRVMADGDDGASFQTLATIDFFVDGTPAPGSVPGRLVFTTSTGGVNSEAGRIDQFKNWVIGTAALATNATNGFLYIESCAGAPTGTPTTYTGRVPIVFDTTNNKIWVFNGTWKGVVVS